MTFRDRDADAADEAVANARRSARHALDDVRRSVSALHDDRRSAWRPRWASWPGRPTTAASR